LENLQQLRARNAYDFIQKNRNEQLKKIALKMPVMFQTNGLLASVAFLLSKTDFNPLSENLLKHLKSDAFGFCLGDESDIESIFLNRWINPNYPASEIRLLTDELISYSGWLKRAAETYTE